MSLIKKKNIPFILLVVFIICEIVYTSFVFWDVKQGFYLDEVWCYALSNSYYRPFFQLENTVSTLDDEEYKYAHTEHFREWVDGKELNDYITVQRGERFRYDSVYYNQYLDHHPPLYYMILHTISSFFPDKFSFWYAFIINIAALIFAQFFLFKLTSSITGNEYAGLIACIFYGCSNGGLSTYIFIRQYAFLTMLAMIYLYLNERLFRSYDEKNGYDLKKYMPLIGIVSFCMFYTNYTVIISVGAFTACFCIYLLIRKRIKQMFIYGLSESAALILLFIVFPASVTKHIGNYYEYDMPFDYMTQVRLMLHYTLAYVTGFGVSFYKDDSLKIVAVCLLVIVLITAPLAFLFRKETWFRKLVGKVKKLLMSIAAFLKNMDYIPVFSAAFILSLDLLLAKMVNISTMKVLTNRYVFVLYPVVCMIVTAIVIGILRKIIPVKKQAIAVIITLVLSVTMSVRSNTFWNVYIVKNSDNYTDLSDITADEKCVVVLSGNDNDETGAVECSVLLNYFTLYLRNSDEVFFTPSYHAIEDIKKIVSSDKQIRYLIVPEMAVDDVEYDKDEIIALKEYISGFSYEDICYVTLQDGRYHVLKLY